MGQNQTFQIDQKSQNSLKNKGILNLNQFLKQYQSYKCQSNKIISSISNNSKLIIFQKNKILQKDPSISQNNDQFYINYEMLAINSQIIYKQINKNQIQSLQNFINYYQKRQQITKNFENNQQINIISLVHFQVLNNKSKQKVYPIKSDINKLQKKQENSNSLIQATCRFDQFFSNKDNNNQQSYSTINLINKNIFQFNFLQQFHLNNLEKQINFRLQNNQYFRQKQIWSILYCCAQAAHKMIKYGLKQPMLSPASIFITQESQIKVGQWQFINYFEHQKQFSDLQNTYQNFFDQGQAIVNLNLQTTYSLNDNKQENMNILTRYYWPPEGIIQIQKMIKLGEIVKNENNQMNLQEKNSQVFSLGMCILQMLTLKSYYQKSTYSQKQLKRLTQNAIKYRQSIQQQMSSQMINLLSQMLEWDPMERINYSGIIQITQKAYQQNSFIFQSQMQSQYMQPLQQQNQNDDQSMNLGKQSIVEFKQKYYPQTNQIMSMYTQMSINQFNNFNQNQYRKQIQHQYQSNFQQTINKSKIQNSTSIMKQTFLKGSQMIIQGQGDDYDPQFQEEQIKIYKKIINYLQPDQQDQENFGLIFNETALIQQRQIPDEQSNQDSTLIFENQFHYCVDNSKLNTQQINYYNIQQDKQFQQKSSRSFDPISGRNKFEINSGRNRFQIVSGRNKFDSYQDKQNWKKGTQETKPLKAIQNNFQNKFIHLSPNDQFLERSKNSVFHTFNKQSQLKQNQNIYQQSLSPSQTSKISYRYQSTIGKLADFSIQVKTENPLIEVKQTVSPCLSNKSKQQMKKQTSAISNFHLDSYKPNQHIFTDPWLMNLVQQYTSKNFNSNRTNQFDQKNSFLNNYSNQYSINSQSNYKQKNYEQKKIGNINVNVNFESSYVNYNPIQNTPCFDHIQLSSNNTALSNLNTQQYSKKLFENNQNNNVFRSATFQTNNIPVNIPTSKSTFNVKISNSNFPVNLNQENQTYSQTFGEKRKTTYLQSTQGSIVKQEFSKGYYEGSKKNGLRNGFGTFYYKQGGRYQGYWYDNKMQGHGILYYPDGRKAYQGQWLNDSLHGKGILFNENPASMSTYSYEYKSFDQCQLQQYWVSYDGWFQNDQKSGYGQLLLINDEKYVGQFKNDMIHGRGKFYSNNGQIVEGRWQNNRLLQN